MDEDDALAPLRSAALDTIGDNAVGLAMPPAGEAPTIPDDDWAPADSGLGGSSPGLAEDVSQRAAQATGNLAASDADPAGLTDPAASAAVGLPQWMVDRIEALLRKSGADKRVDRTITGITGGEFSPAERQVLEDRLLGKAHWSDIPTLTGIQEGPPVYLTPSQKAAVDRIVGKLGPDPLAQRAQTAYQKALNAGQVRIR